MGTRQGSEEITFADVFPRHKTALIVYWRVVHNSGETIAYSVPKQTTSNAHIHERADTVSENTQIPQPIRAVLNGEKKVFHCTVFPKKARGHTMCWRWAVSSWWLATGGWCRLVAVSGGWRRLVVGDWWLMAAGSGWWLAVGRRWRLAAVGGWRLMVPWGGPYGRSLTKKNLAP